MKPTIEEKQKRLEQNRAKLLQKAQKLKSEARKIETRRMIQLGELVKKAGLSDLDDDALLGGLLELNDLASQETTLQRWRKLGNLGLTSNNSEAIIVTFVSPPPKELVNLLKNAGLKWNQFRNEWQGYAILEEIEQLLIDFPATIQRPKSSQ